MSAPIYIKHHACIQYTPCYSTMNTLINGQIILGGPCSFLQMSFLTNPCIMGVLRDDIMEMTEL